MKPKIIIESSNSYSKIFIGINEYFKKKENLVIIPCNNRWMRKIRSILPDVIIPNVSKVSMTMMPDLYWGLGQKSVVWIHDTLYFEEDYVFGDCQNRFEGEKIRLSKIASDCSLVITPSEYSKRKIIKFLKLPPEKIKVVNCQIPVEEYTQVCNDDIFLNHVAQKYEFMGAKNLIFIGSPHFRKNLKTVLDVFEELEKIYPNITLRVISYSRKDIVSTFADYQRLMDMPKVKLISSIPNRELIALLRLSDILINPSLEEGFGLPNIEAQICGTPVISSSASCIPEIMNDSAILIDPLNKLEIIEACNAVLEEKIDIFNLRTRGLVNSRLYTNLNNYDVLWQHLLELA